MFYLALFVLLSAFFFFWQAARQRHRAGLPGGRVIYADTGGWGAVEKPLYDPVLGLTGKPDYLVEQDNLLIPVEVKSAPISQAPYDAHIFQLAAYCLLVQRVYNKRPPYGILHYPNRTYAVDYTPELETTVRDIMTEMQAHSRRKMDRSHESPARCARCGFRSICDQVID